MLRLLKIATENEEVKPVQKAILYICYNIVRQLYPLQVTVENLETLFDTLNAEFGDETTGIWELGNSYGTKINAIVRDWRVSILKDTGKVVLIPKFLPFGQGACGYQIHFDNADAWITLYEESKSRETLLDNYGVPFSCKGDDISSQYPNLMKKLVK